MGNKVKELAGVWTAYTALGSYALYLLGYLVLRFHLTALGFGTDLAVLDERYLFAGAKFLVYLVSSAPIVLLIGLVLSAFMYPTYRFIAGRGRGKPGDTVKTYWERLRIWWSDPDKLTLTGIILSVVIIQAVMRQCFFFSNLLLAPGLPEPGWLRSLLLTPDDGPRSNGIK